MFSRLTLRTLNLPKPRDGDDLVVRLQDGDLSAVAQVYDQHHQVLRAFALRLLGDEGAAEDLVHEVFVRLPDLVGRFRGDSSLRSFLMGVVVNHVRHHARSSRRRQRQLERLKVLPQRESPAPDSQAEDLEFLQRLHQALSELPVDQQIAFILCHVEERTASEAAHLSGTSEATIRSRLFHACRKLRAQLEEGHHG
jgi:RNA polymerase sigma-70 factor (ECF subfamily)